MIDDEARQDTGEDVDLAQMPSLAERQIVQGTVVRVDSEGVLVDVGAKSEGFIPPKELSARGDALSYRAWKFLGRHRVSAAVVHEPPVPAVGRQPVGERRPGRAFTNRS